MWKVKGGATVYTNLIDKFAVFVKTEFRNT